jgi:hypothetical protein
MGQTFRQKGKVTDYQSLGWNGTSSSLSSGEQKEKKFAIWFWNNSWTYIFVSVQWSSVSPKQENKILVILDFRREEDANRVLRPIM